MPDSPLHPIQVAARRSGLSAERIRAWERRYRAVTPARAGNQRRLYRDEEIERLRLLARAIQAGRRIGDIARLPSTEIQAMVEGDERDIGPPPVLISSRPRTDAVMEYFDRCLEAVDAMDPERLAKALNDAEENLAELFAQEDLIAPLIQHMREECRGGTLRAAQKRMAENVIRGHLLSYATRLGASSTFRVVVAGRQPGMDDLPLLRLAVAVRAYGWQPIFLGAGLPSDEIAYAAKRGQALCTAIAAHPVDDALLPNELRKLRGALPESHPLFLHGPNLSLFKAVLDETQIIPIRTFGELRLALNRMRLAAQDGAKFADRPSSIE